MSPTPNSWPAPRHTKDAPHGSLSLLPSRGPAGGREARHALARAGEGSRRCCGGWRSADRGGGAGARGWDGAGDQRPSPHVGGGHTAGGRLGSRAPVLTSGTAARAWGGGGPGSVVSAPRLGRPAVSLLTWGRERAGDRGGGTHRGPWHTQACPLPAGEGSDQHQALPVPRCPHSPSPWWAEARKMGDVPPEPLPFLAQPGSVPSSCPSVPVPSAPGDDRTCRVKPLGPDVDLHRGWGGGQAR